MKIMSNISWEPKMSKCQGWFVAMLSYYHAVVWHIKCLMQKEIGVIMSVNIENQFS